ncbi:hypothetical protein MPSEU_000885800 [Mayamaea pseudoterrestris]|nr:hypothetical protein MPSEU_000885800 [Mayamaea pseudoterrestris]
MSNNPYTALQHGGMLSNRTQTSDSRPQNHYVHSSDSHSSSRRSSLQQAATQSQQSAPPTAELSENHAWVRLTVDLPGVHSKDLDVAIHYGILTITGARQTLSVDGNVVLKKHKFSRRYAIDTDIVDVTKVSANLSLGVLTVKAPKRTRLQDRVKVDVTVGDRSLMSQDASGNFMNANANKNSVAAIAPVGSSAVTTAASEGTFESLGQSTLAANEPGQGKEHNVSVGQAPQMVRPDEETDSMATPSPDEDGSASKN